jgi:hypothetical protein
MERESHEERNKNTKPVLLEMFLKGKEREDADRRRSKSIA